MTTPTTPRPLKPCPTDCGRVVRAGHLLCGACWRKVPGPIGNEVHRTWRAWRRDFGNADLMAAYEAASEAAIDAASEKYLPERMRDNLLAALAGEGQVLVLVHEMTDALVAMRELSSALVSADVEHRMHLAYGEERINISGGGGWAIFVAERRDYVGRHPLTGRHFTLVAIKDCCENPPGDAATIRALAPMMPSPTSEIRRYPA